jgi:hypothetical protein
VICPSMTRQDSGVSSRSRVKLLFGSSLSVQGATQIGGESLLTFVRLGEYVSVKSTIQIGGSLTVLNEAHLGSC